MIDIIKRLLKKKYILFIAAITLIFGFLASMYNILILNRQSAMVIEFNYPGAERGLNPDGSVFEISELKSPEIIEKAKENLKTSDDAEFLRSRISILTKVSGQSIERIISAVQNEKNVVYMPTAFHVYYSQKNKLSRNEARLFMESLAKAYTDYFSEKYSEKNDVLKYSSEDYDFSETDYLEIHRIFQNKVDSMLSLIKAHQNENRAFYTEDRANLGMAAKKLESYRDTNLDKFYAYVVQNGLSKDNHELLRTLDYFINDNLNEYRKLIEGSDIVKGSVEQYKQNIIVAFVPSVDSKRNFYMSRTLTGADYLIKQSYNDGISATKILKDIEDYTNLKNKFSAPAYDVEAKRENVETMIKNLSVELEQLSKEVLSIDGQYLEHKAMNYFDVRLPEYSFVRIIFILKFMIIGFILSFALVIFAEFMKKRFLEKLRGLDAAFSTIEFIKKNRGE